MNYSVLIVDDETELAESTAEYFNMFDVPSKCVFTAEDALGFFKDNTAKLILLDINLSEEGGMSGFDLCKKIRETLDVPILFIRETTHSRHSSKKTRIACFFSCRA